MMVVGKVLATVIFSVAWRTVRPSFHLWLRIQRA